MKRAAFQSFVAKLREPAMRPRSTETVGPDEAAEASVKRTASAPNSSIASSGIDHVALRLRHLLAAHAHEPVQVDACENGARPVKRRPAMIIRATQKKRMS